MFGLIIIIICCVCFLLNQGARNAQIARENKARNDLGKFLRDRARSNRKPTQSGRLKHPRNTPLLYKMGELPQKGRKSRRGGA